MGRPLSQFINDFFASRATADAKAYNTHLGVEITLNNGNPVRYSTGDVVMDSISSDGVSVAVDPVKEFDDKMLNSPEFIFSQTNRSDGSTPFDISNLDYLITALVPEPSRLFDNAETTVYLCFPKPNGNYEGLRYAVGRLQGIGGDDETARLSFVSDMSDNSRLVGGFEISQRCQNTFQVNEGFSFCPAAGYADHECTKEFLDGKPVVVEGITKAGCLYYGMQPFFNGVSFWNPNTVDGYSGGLPEGGGWDEPTVGCPDENMFFKTKTDDWIIGTKLKAGMLLKNHRGSINIIDKVDRIWADYRYRISTFDEKIIKICSASHPLLTAFDDNKGSAALSLIPDQNDNSTFNQIRQRQNDLQVIRDDEGWNGEGVKIVTERRKLTNLEFFNIVVAPAGWVLRLTLTGDKLALAGDRPNFGFGFHNNKPIYKSIQY